jgi:peptide/nickel transport system substrate-binding protein
MGGAIVRVDRAPIRRVPLGGGPTALAFGGSGGMWVSAVEPQGSHRGGRLVVEGQYCAEQCPVDPDVALAQTFDMLGLAYDGLVGYRRTEGTAGGTVVAALAESVPEPQDGGRIYAFTLRPGLRFSNGRPVRATDVRASLERAVRNSGWTFPDYFSAIAGAGTCASRPRRCDMSRGIRVDDAARTITLRLTRPDPAMLLKLANPVASIVPAGTPDKLVGRAPPGTGPYRIVSLDARGGGTLVRNPHFRTWGPGFRPAGFADEIVIHRQKDLGVAADRVERGASDIAVLYGGAEPVPASRLARIQTRYPARISGAPAVGTDYMFLNVNERPFDDVRVRRAINLATDRRRMVELFRAPASAACETVPATSPDAQPYCPYTAGRSAAGTWTAPDVGAARRLIGASGTRGSHVTVWVDTIKVRYGRYFARLLRRLGYRTDLKVIEAGLPYYRRVGDPRTHAQMGWFAWFADYPNPASFFNPVFSCSGRTPTSQSSLNYNVSQFCDRTLDRLVHTAQQTRGVAGEKVWARAERRLADQAPAVPLLSRRDLLFTSSRVGNAPEHLFLGPLLDRAWVR